MKTVTTFEQQKNAKTPVHDVATQSPVTFARKRVTPRFLPLAAHELAGARRVIDIGCGDGQVSRLAAANGIEHDVTVIGIDQTWN